MTRREHATALLTDVNDFLAGLETALHAATIDEQIAIEQATETVYGPNEGNHYNQLTHDIAGLRDRIHDRIHDRLNN